jgi:hypothetical protein
MTNRHTRARKLRDAAARVSTSPILLVGAAGLALLIAVLSSNAGGTDAASIADGARAAFTVGAVIAGVAIVAVFFLPRQARNAV